LRVTLALRDSIPFIPVEYVELTEAEEAEALLTLDPIAALAGSDKDNLETLLAKVGTENDAVLKLLEDTAAGAGLEWNQPEESDDKYTKKVEAPIYEIKGEKPSISELYNDVKYKELISELEAEKIPQDVREFLQVAATRHIVFDFSKIAEYYAHALQDVQRLMENSALVIVDFNRAIELGYVKLSEEIQNQFSKEHPND
jgi:hypothetical protein